MYIGPQFFESVWIVPIAAFFLIVGSISLTYTLSNLPPWPFVSGTMPGEMAFIASENRVQIEQTVSDLSALELVKELGQRVDEIPTQLYELSREILESDRKHTHESVDPNGPFDWSYFKVPSVALTALGMVGSAIVFLVGLYFSTTKKRRDDALHQLEIEKLQLEIGNLKNAK